MRDRKAIEIEYKGFNRDFSLRFEAEPYCLRQFKQRWYMVAKTAASETEPWIYGLDRIVSLERTERALVRVGDNDVVDDTAQINCIQTLVDRVNAKLNSAEEAPAQTEEDDLPEEFAE